MKRPNLILLIIGLLLLIPVSIGIIKTVEFEKSKVITGYIYEGKVLMNQQEYTAFKSILARDDVDILELDVYLPDNPLVIFKAIIPPDVSFPYGDQSDTCYGYSQPKSEQVFFSGFLTVGLWMVSIGIIIASFLVGYSSVGYSRGKE